MNPVFTALAAVAFGLMLVAGDASATNKSAHHEPARKAAAPSKSAAKSASRPAVKTAPKAVPKATASRGKVVKPVAMKAPAKVKVLSAREARAAAREEARASKAHGSARADKRVSKAAPVVKEAPARGRAAKHHRGRREDVQLERPRKKGRYQVEAAAEPVREASSRKEQKRAGREAFVPIGREAFVPTSPPVRQAADRRALVTPPPLQAPQVQPRPPVSAPQPVTVAPSAPVALRPTTELPRPAPRVLVPLAASSAGLSGAEAAAASAAAVSQARAPEPAHVAPQPVVPAAPLAPAPSVASPLQPMPAIQQPQSARPGRGLARAYAMDGATFYQSGRKIRVQGLDVKEPGMTSEHATQRLQRALDSGNLTVEPVEVDASGHTLAVVRVNGRNVADSVRAVAN
jgi:hypothetical protein